LDLHTHPFEAMGFPEVNVDSVKKIVEVARLRGLHGLAVTEHGNKDYGFRAKEICDRYFHPFQIIAGWEIEATPQVHIIELFVPHRVWRILAHPFLDIDYTPFLRGVDAVETLNKQHRGIISFELLQTVDVLGLKPIGVSDAHRLEDIGYYWVDIDFWEEAHRRGGR